MKLLSLIFVILSLHISGCDTQSSTAKKENRPPWGKWLPPDAEHPEKRLEVKFGDVLYRIPESYMAGMSPNLTKYEEKSIWISVSYPDLIPRQKQENKKPEYPSLDLFMGGDRGSSSTISSYPEIFANALKTCGKPVISTLAKHMYQYSCGKPYHYYYFTPMNSDIKTPLGYQLVIRCYDQIPDAHGMNAKYECAIDSPLFDDGRYLTSRIHVDDFTNLLDIYYKALQLLTSLEARVGRTRLRYAA